MEISEIPLFIRRRFCFERQSVLVRFKGRWTPGTPRWLGEARGTCTGKYSNPEWGLVGHWPNPSSFLLSSQQHDTSQSSLEGGVAKQLHLLQMWIGMIPHLQACPSVPGTRPSLVPFSCLPSRGRGPGRGPQGPRKPQGRKSLSRTSFPFPPSSHFVLANKGQILVLEQ